jgi:hypothetical protein
LCAIVLPFSDGHKAMTRNPLRLGSIYASLDDKSTDLRDSSKTTGPAPLIGLTSEEGDGLPRWLKKTKAMAIFYA